MSAELSTVHGRLDDRNRLVEADDALLELHRSCGGTPGQTLAVPELLALVNEARDTGLTLSRQFRAVTIQHTISAWAKLIPQEAGASGCKIAVSDWQVEGHTAGLAAAGKRYSADILQELADCTVRVDEDGRILSIDTDASDLQHAVFQFRDGKMTSWTEFATANKGSAEAPDGTETVYRLSGSSRTWSASMDDGVGMTVFLEANEPLGLPLAAETAAPSLGRDLTPVLRQPVNRIIANAETIRTRLAGPLKDEYSDYAGDIASAGQHLLALIDDLADLEVVEDENFSTAPDQIDLADVARRACGILGVRAAERQIALEAPAEGEALYATAEFRRVLQVLLNLIGNAIRYSPEGSRVWIRLTLEGERAGITVADQGHGLDAGQQAKVFEKFERLGRGDDGGSGLGLYISRRIARAMGGDLTVESAPGQGARFTLSVPARSAST